MPNLFRNIFRTQPCTVAAHTVACLCTAGGSRFVFTLDCHRVQSTAHVRCRTCAKNFRPNTLFSLLSTHSNPDCQSAILKWNLEQNSTNHGKRHFCKKATKNCGHLPLRDFCASFWILQQQNAKCEKITPTSGRYPLFLIHMSPLSKKIQRQSELRRDHLPTAHSAVSCTWRRL